MESNEVDNKMGLLGLREECMKSGGKVQNRCSTDIGTDIGTSLINRVSKTL